MSQKEQLQNFWNELGHSSKEYIAKDQLITLAQKVLTEKQIMENIPDHAEMDKMIDQYVAQVLQVDPNTVENIQFKFQQAHQFYQWLTGNYPQQQYRNASKVTNVADNQSKVKEEAPNKQNESKQPEIQEQPKEEENKEEEKKEEEKQQIQQQKEQLEIQKQKSKEEEENKENIKVQDKNDEDEKYMYPHNAETQPVNAKHQENQNQFNQFADDEEIIKHQSNRQNSSKISSNYRQYLLIIFEHYCRMSYATGNDPTFEQIQQKTQIMTINKFMIFCKEFGIIKLSNMSRNGLVEMFKKNAEYFKEMNFEQFMKVLCKIASIVFGDEENVEPAENGKQFERMLLFLEVNNGTVFKKKMASLNISYRGKNGEQIKQKIQLPNYKFKYLPNNGKSSEQIQQEIQQRKKIRSEKKIQIRNSLSKQKLDNSKNSIKKQNQQRNERDRPQLSSTPNPNHTKVLAPPKPPARKEIKGSRSQTLSNVTGYSNIHRLKMKKDLIQDPKNVDPRLKLNSIVEEARKMIHSNPIEQEYLYQHHSRQSSNRNIESSQLSSNLGYRYVHGHSSRNNQNLLMGDQQSPVKHIYGKQSYLRRQIHHQNDKNDLNELIDNESDEDEFLAEHLERERKNDQISQRIEAKIQEIKVRENNQR